MQDLNLGASDLERPIAQEPEHSGEPIAEAADSLLADDPRVLQILSAEHWSLLTARSLPTP